MPLSAPPSPVWEDRKPWSLPVITVVTLERPLLAVPKTNVIAQGGGQWAGHVTQRALVMVHCKRMGGKHHRKAGDSTRSSQPHLGERAFTHHGSSYGHGAASLWQTSWSSENTETSALHHRGQGERGEGGEKIDQSRENSTKSSKH